MTGRPVAGRVCVKAIRCCRTASSYEPLLACVQQHRRCGSFLAYGSTHAAGTLIALLRLSHGPGLKAYA